MSLIVIPNTFSAGAVIIASQHNSNFSTIYTDYNGNIDNTNIATTAAIAYSKLNLTSGIVNGDINASAAIANSKLNLASITGTINIGTAHQGDIFYDNGTTLTRLTPGTSGLFLQTQGAGANPQWSFPNTSNVLFQYAGQIDQQGASIGEVVGTTLLPNAQTGNYRFLQALALSAYTSVATYKFIKIAGISTVKVYGRIWGRLGTMQASLKVDIGGQNNTGSVTLGTTTPTWVTFTIDVSTLTNGNVYDVTCSIGDTQNIIGSSVYCANIIGFVS